MYFFKPKKLLMLGKSSLPEDIELLTLNKPQQLNNCHTLFSFSFDEMMDNNENKKAFWEQMKQL
jgi:DNA polymerase III psi subunit